MIKGLHGKTEAGRCFPHHQTRPPAPFKASISYNLIYKLTKIHLETDLISSLIQLLLHKASFRTLFL